jgi:hypothetical protein
MLNRENNAEGGASGQLRTEIDSSGDKTNLTNSFTMEQAGNGSTGSNGWNDTYIKGYDTHALMRDCKCKLWVSFNLEPNYFTIVPNIEIQPHRSALFLEEPSWISSPP